MKYAKIDALGEPYMSNDKLIEWKRKGEHLPKFLRDQDDQNHFIRLMSHYYQDADKDNPLNTHSHGILNKYLFNVFFDYFADNGITLQPIKHKTIEFLNLEQELKDYKDFESGLREDFTLQTTPMWFEIDSYRQQLLFLPEFMNTFDRFKYIFRDLHRDESNIKKYGSTLAEIDNRDGTVFIIDFVLWFCAKYGYKLQMSKKRIEFNSHI